MLGMGATRTAGVSVTLALCRGPLSPTLWDGDDCRDDELWLFLERRRDSLGLGIGGTSAMLLLFSLFLS